MTEVGKSADPLPAEVTSSVVTLVSTTSQDDTGEKKIQR